MRGVIQSILLLDAERRWCLGILNSSDKYTSLSRRRIYHPIRAWVVVQLPITAATFPLSSPNHSHPSSIDAIKSSSPWSIPSPSPPKVTLEHLRRSYAQCSSTRHSHARKCGEWPRRQHTARHAYRRKALLRTCWRIGRRRSLAGQLCIKLLVTRLNLLWMSSFKRTARSTWPVWDTILYVEIWRLLYQKR